MYQLDIGICTFQRTSILSTLESIGAQIGIESLTVRVIVADNDDTPKKRREIEQMGADAGVDLLYVHAPARNISIARNACLDSAEGRFFAFIDDDEIADPGWAASLIQAAIHSGKQVIFGPVLGEYAPEAPNWMRENNFHSFFPAIHNGVIDTVNSGNALLDLDNPVIRETRFRESFGRTGGEDVDFFFRLLRAGVGMGVSDTAIVREPVEPKRATLSWLLNRRFTVGKIYGHCSQIGAPVAGRAGFVARAAVKAAYCALRALLAAFSRRQASFWLLRCTFHAGSMTGVFRPPSREFYGR